jgi:hypothetical protein
LERWKLFLTDVQQGQKIWLEFAVGNHTAKSFLTDLMKTPIIVDNRGDVLVFETISDMESYIEVIDVKNNEYKFFDGTGGLLTVGIQNDHSREKVKIVNSEDLPTHQSEVRSILINLFKTVSDTSIDFDSYTWDQLISKALEYKTK